MNDVKVYVCVHAYIRVYAYMHTHTHIRYADSEMGRKKKRGRDGRDHAFDHSLLSA